MMHRLPRYTLIQNFNTFFCLAASTDCTEETQVDTVNLIAYEQWPFRLSCNLFAGEETWYDWLLYEAVESELINVRIQYTLCLPKSLTLKAAI